MLSLFRRKRARNRARMACVLAAEDSVALEHIPTLGESLYGFLKGYLPMFFDRFGCHFSMSQRDDCGTISGCVRRRKIPGDGRNDIGFEIGKSSLKMLHLDIDPRGGSDHVLQLAVAGFGWSVFLSTDNQTLGMLLEDYLPERFQKNNTTGFSIHDSAFWWKLVEQDNEQNPKWASWCWHFPWSYDYQKKEILTWDMSRTVYEEREIGRAHV